MRADRNVEDPATTEAWEAAKVTTTGVVHIAGLDVTVDERQYRQRCAWCGAVLFDYDLARVAVPAGQESGGPGRWEPGALVAVDGAMRYMVEPADDGKLPAEACARLPHDVTGHQ